MKSWEIGTLDLRPHAPEILSTTEDARAIALEIPAGERLSDHQVHERAWVTVINGEVEFTTDAGENVAGGCGAEGGVRAGRAARSAGQDDRQAAPAVDAVAGQRPSRGDVPRGQGHGQTPRRRAGGEPMSNQRPASSNGAAGPRQRNPLLEAHRFLRRGPVNAEGWSQLVAKDRDWERSYRGRWRTTRSSVPRTGSIARARARGTCSSRTGS